MAARQRRSLGYLAGQLLAVLLVAAAAYVLYLLISANDQTRLAVLTAAISVGTLVYTQNKNARREIDSRHFARKAEVYERILSIINELMVASRNNEELPEGYLLEQLTAIQPQLLIWAGPEVLRAWQGISEAPDEGNGPLIAGNNLMAALRKELGHHNDEVLGPLGLIATFLKPEDRRKLLGRT
jgi:hypothetical protein